MFVDDSVHFDKHVCEFHGIVPQVQTLKIIILEVPAMSAEMYENNY